VHPRQKEPVEATRATENRADAALDLIFIEGLRAETIIGIDSVELHRPQPLDIDVVLGVPSVAACQSDRIGDTIHYGEVREAILELLRDHRLQLLEALAEEIAQIALGRFGATWVRVRVAKPAKFADLTAVGVQIERRRVIAAQRPAAVLSLIGAGMVPHSHDER
jgi:7,8-dihydroneopterin aldolase/epimerase/oxygenase